MQSPSDTNEDKSGKIIFQNDEIIFTYGKDELMRFSFSDIVVMGEMTLGGNTSFLVFVSKKGKQYCVPCHHTINIIELIVYLSNRLNIKFAPSLIAPEPDSRVIYPPDIAGKRIFYFITDGPPGKFRVSDSGVGLRLILREEIKNYKPGSK